MAYRSDFVAREAVRVFKGRSPEMDRPPLCFAARLLRYTVEFRPDLLPDRPSIYRLVVAQDGSDAVENETRFKHPAVATFTLTISTMP